MIKPNEDQYTEFTENTDSEACWPCRGNGCSDCGGWGAIEYTELVCGLCGRGHREEKVYECDKCGALNEVYRYE